MKNSNMEKFFDSLITEDSFFEVRILHTNKGTISGYFNDSNKLLKAINQYDGKYNIFFTLNTVIPDITSRSLNHFTEWAKNTTTDKEIIQRDWILIDLDPERPAGISSTDEELSNNHLKAMRGQISHVYMLEYGQDKRTHIRENQYFEV